MQLNKLCENLNKLFYGKKALSPEKTEEFNKKLYYVAVGMWLSAGGNEKKDKEAC